MDLSFENYMPLYLILPIVVVFVGIYKRFMSRNQLRFLILRLISVILIILSLCSISLLRYAKDTTTIFLADLSNSTTANREEIGEVIETALTQQGENDRVGVISFGRNSIIENSANKMLLFNGFYGDVNGEFTNIQNALIHATAMMPNNTKKRIVLITDGNENIGDVRRQISKVIDSHIAIDYYPLNTVDFEEVQLVNMVVPEKSERNQKVDITIGIESNIKTQSTVLIYSNDQLKYENQVELDIGTNQFVFTDIIEEGGVTTYTGQIIPQHDSFNQNNYLSTFTIVNDLPKILMIQDEEEQGSNLIGMLEDVANLEIRLPEEVPSTYEELIKYDAFIMADISIERLGSEFLSNLETVVKIGGKGLLVTGGDSSFGPGGYYKTTLEEMLPVNMEAKPKEDKPNLGLILVIDKSGSMGSGSYGVTKMELAKEAAIRATEVLDEKDRLGVIGFDSEVKWVLEPENVVDKGAIESRIGTMVPGGGTVIRPSLAMAVEELKEMDVALKHIILLTDGQAENSGYAAILEDMMTNEITLSTVAVGEGADRRLLKNLAYNGNGRYYATDVFSDIPSIFTKEAFMAGKKYLNNVTFTPNVTNYSAIIDGISGFPELDGYVATSIKDMGKLVLSGPDDDPILATWQYGIGRCIAYTSDMKGIWSTKWLGWDENQALWLNTINYIVQQDINKNYTVSSAYDEGMGEIFVESIGKEIDYVGAIGGILVDPEGNELEIILEAVAPGKYKGSFTPSGEGVYLVNLSIEGEEKSERIIAGVNVGYSKEYDFINTNRLEASEIVGNEFVRIIDNPKSIFDGKVPEVKGSKDISRLLLILALILFMIEITLRKTQLKLERIVNYMARLAPSERKSVKVESESNTGINRLLEQKRKRNQ